MNKVFSSFDEAVADVPDGAVIMFSGFADPAAWPHHLIWALRNQGAKNLTAISSNMGIGPYLSRGPGAVGPGEIFAEISILVENGQIRKGISTVFGSGRYKRTYGLSLPIEKAYLAGEVETELVPLGTLEERIRAGGAGIGGFYTPVGVGTIIAEGKETRLIDGREYILEFPLRADYAFIRAHKADKLGNLVYKGTSRCSGPTMATAADITIAEVDEIIEPGELDPEVIVTPGIFVDRIVKITEPGMYPKDRRSHETREGKL